MQVHCCHQNATLACGFTYYIFLFLGSFPPATNTSSPLPNIPDLPDVPTGSLPGSHSTVGGASAGDDLDFDDLNRRFEELKKKK